MIDLVVMKICIVVILEKVKAQMREKRTKLKNKYIFLIYYNKDNLKNK